MKATTPRQRGKAPRRAVSKGKSIVPQLQALWKLATVKERAAFLLTT